MQLFAALAHWYSCCLVFMAGSNALHCTNVSLHVATGRVEQQELHSTSRMNVSQSLFTFFYIDLW